METWGAAIATALAIIAAALKSWQLQKAKKEDCADEERVQQYRKRLAADDGSGLDALSAEQHDRVQRALCGDPGGADSDSEKSNPR